MTSFFAKSLWYFQRIKSWIFGVYLPGIRVIMYHKISENHQDFLTITAAQFEQQLLDFRAKGFNFISAQALLDYFETAKPLPPKPILLSFDDGYLNNLSLAYPILQAHSAKAIIFLPTNFLGKTSAWDTPNDEPLMTVEQLKSMDSNLVEFGLHSHKHLDYGNISLSEMEQDLQACLDFFDDNTLSFTPVFAYPYGSRPKKKKDLEAMKALFVKKNIKMAFRIGNRVNPFEGSDLYQIQRLDTYRKSVKKH
jgi:peptidoglycan/xylan/chitin deacetylase (PgdA/CDA1 family)